MSIAEEKKAKQKAYAAAWYRANKERHDTCLKAWEKSHPEKARAIKQRWIENNPAKRAESTARYREANRDEMRAYGRAYMARKRRENPEVERAKTRTWQRGNFKFRVAKVLRGRVRDAIKSQLGSDGKKCDRTMSLIGCAVEEVIAHIAGQFKEGMAWDNWGNRDGCWVIDHIRPCASFDLRDPTQQRQCFRWTNLQSLWWRENMEKGDRWDPNQAA